MTRELGERDAHRAIVFVQEIDDKGVLVAVVLDYIVVHVHENSAFLLFVDSCDFIRVKSIFLGDCIRQASDVWLAEHESVEDLLSRFSDVQEYF